MHISNPPLTRPEGQQGLSGAVGLGLVGLGAGLGGLGDF